MSKIRMTFEVDSNELFDRLVAVKDQGSLLGARLVEVMLTGKLYTSTAIGLACYGVEVKEIERADQQFGAHEKP